MDDFTNTKNSMLLNQRILPRGSPRGGGGRQVPKTHNKLPFSPRPSHTERSILHTMSNQAKTCTSTVIPGLRYRDALAAIDWLTRAFGFEKQAVYMGAGNTVMHAQLTFGNGMIMLGSVDNGTPSTKLTPHPTEIDLTHDHTPYLI